MLYQKSGSVSKQTFYFVAMLRKKSEHTSNSLSKKMILVKSTIWRGTIRYHSNRRVNGLNDCIFVVYLSSTLYISVTRTCKFITLENRFNCRHSPILTLQMSALRRLNFSGFESFWLLSSFLALKPCLSGGDISFLQIDLVHAISVGWKCYPC